jgi:hypothetical protein
MKLLYFLLSVTRVLFGYFTLFVILMIFIKHIVSSNVTNFDLFTTLLFIIIYLYILFLLSKFIDFGKYKGKRWSELPDDYLNWLTLSDLHGKAAQTELDKRLK